jgi:Na+-driven multidrug efflux pump
LRSRGTANNAGHAQGKKDITRASKVGIYTLILFILAMLSMLSVWPGTTRELAMNMTTTRTITFMFLLPARVGPELLLAVTTVLAGFIGACVYSLYAIILHLSPPKKDFDKNWTGWYVLRPIVGAGLALIVYVLIRGGLLSVGSNVSNLNFLGFTGFSFIVGLFTEPTMHKLNDLADTMFGVTDEKTSGQEAKKKTT